LILGLAASDGSLMPVYGQVTCKQMAQKLRTASAPMLASYFKVFLLSTLFRQLAANIKNTKAKTQQRTK